ncbi:ankyrin repeat domain-containing protein [uncultured Cloacibacillus sp.]|uniref:ankyrin repeat domain-containing protein n=1 Tax=uncultured Cloacibacillus sp. TaxID=889794 RepID=UPI0026DC284F|nr:hypothetical protein [uncultured Cloacibacillus sp.]
MSNNTIQNFSEEDIKNFSQMKSEMYRIATSMKAYRNANRFETLFKRSLRAGYPVDFTRGGGDDTLLYLVLTSGTAEVVKIANMLIEAGADVNHTNWRNENALMMAARYSYGAKATDQLIPVLLPLTEDLDCKNKYGETALMLFCQSLCVYSQYNFQESEKEIIQMFLGAGANINDLLDPQKWGMSNTPYWKNKSKSQWVEKRTEKLINLLLHSSIQETAKEELQNYNAACYDNEL